MSPLVTIVLPGCILGLAYTLAVREWRQYRASTQAPDESDLFVYSHGRLVRRLTGVAVLAGLGLTFASLGVAPPRSPGGASLFIALVVAEVAALVVLPLWDLWETARTARPERRFTLPSTEARRTRRPPRRPR